jgi:hypothetical protein
VADVNNRAYDNDVLEALLKRLFIGGGAMSKQPPDAGAAVTKYVPLQSR